MAAKLILSMDGVVLKEYALNKERMTIGRKPHNDIVIDNLAVSGEHAALVTILNDSFLEDLDSTNGVAVNGEQIKKHFLQNNDVIEIGKYKLKYLNDQQTQTTAADFEKTMVLRGPVAGSRPADKTGEATSSFMKTQVNVVPSATQGATTGKFEAAATAKQPSGQQPGKEAAAKTPAGAAAPAPGGGVSPAAVQILTGPNTGKELELVKNLTTLGKPGLQVAVITRRPHGYFITHVEGAKFPEVNGESLDEHPHQLNDHDIIELAGVKMEFYFKT
jgi:predicted component of type VI protein secretion system